MVPRFANIEIHDRHEFLQPVYRGADLQDGDVMPIEFLPETLGEYEFTRLMGFCPGKLFDEQEV